MIGTKLKPTDTMQVKNAIKRAHRNGERVCIAGGRHAMGGQQFLTAGLLLDMTDMKKVLHFDNEQGLIEVESGICWPDLIAYLKQTQHGREFQWTIAQKQTGCDSLSIGGALAANVHGRGLARPPIINDIENFDLALDNGDLVRCDRNTNSELFGLNIGGYGLFGVMTSATLRLVPRTLLQRNVELADAGDVVAKLEERAAAGSAYGDFQFQIDDKAPGFLTTGILSTYAPVELSGAVTNNKLLSSEEWRELLYLAHANKPAAFNTYAKHYLATDGQLYWSDTFQLATYMDDYHRALDARLPNACRGTELISELYVPRESLNTFLSDAADLLREQHANVIYGTVRLIEQDNESFLAWAKQRWACVVFNLHVDHTPHGLDAARKSFSDLIDLAIRHGGTYYLTYHRFASRRQILHCYPQLPDFFRYKEKYDPTFQFSSDWYEHSRKLIASED